MLHRFIALPTPTIIRCISGGFLAQMMSTLMGSVVIATLFFAPLVQKGLTQEEALQQLLASPLLSSFHLSVALLGILGALIGGFITARMARQQELMMAALLALFLFSFEVVTSLMSLLMARPDNVDANTTGELSFSWAMALALLILEFIFTIVGGRLAKNWRLYGQLWRNEEK